MGKVIAFWSPFAGHSGVTSSMCAVAGAFGLWYPEVQIALCHTNPKYRDLEEKIDVREGEKSEIYEKFGLTALSISYMQSILTSEKIRHCAVPLLMNSLSLFPGEERKEEISDKTYRIITKYLANEFTYVFLDLESGHGVTSDKFLQGADFIVVVLPQAPAFFRRFVSEEAVWLESKKYCLLIGGYEKASKFGVTYLKRQKEGNMKEAFAGTIPVNTGFMDAMQEGKALDFFLRNQMSAKKEENYEFMVQTKKAAEVIKQRILVS